MGHPRGQNRNGVSRRRLNISSVSVPVTVRVCFIGFRSSIGQYCFYTFLGQTLQRRFGRIRHLLFHHFRPKNLLIFMTNEQFWAEALANDDWMISQRRPSQGTLSHERLLH